MKIKINNIDLIYNNLDLKDINILSFISEGNFGKVFNVYDSKSKKKNDNEIRNKKLIISKNELFIKRI